MSSGHSRDPFTAVLGRARGSAARNSEPPELSDAQRLKALADERTTWAYASEVGAAAALRTRADQLGMTVINGFFESTEGAKLKLPLVLVLNAADEVVGILGDSDNETTVIYRVQLPSRNR